MTLLKNKKIGTNSNMPKITPKITTFSKLGLVIEIDGSSHDEKGKYDVEREKYLVGFGLLVLHYTDLEVKKSINFVSESLQLEIKKRVSDLS
jgi:very-short-patch-repair endonuclease